jgi:hypothetical protein
MRGDPETADVRGERGERGEGGGLRPSRAIGGSLTALVRATALYRKGVEKFAIEEEGGASLTQRAVADRTARAWRKAGETALEIEATRVLVGGEEALRADNEHAQWVLYAFMAGVRRIQPRRAMTANDVIRLVQALVTLEPTLKSIDHFRDWLDADGAEGFDVRVHTSFREVFEEIDLEEEREFSRAFSMARFEVPRSGDAVWIAARDLDAVAMRREFEVPIEMYVSNTAESAALGGMTDEELEAIGAQCNDANAWATAELEAVLALPALRTAVTPEHMARRVVTRLSQEADERFLMLLTKLNTKSDPFRQAVARALGTQEVGEIVARQLRLEEHETIEALGRFLVLSPAPLAQAVVLGLIERASDDRLAVDAIQLLAEWYGSAQFCEWVMPPSLSVEGAAVLGRALGRVAPSAAELGPIAVGAPLEAALALLEALPAESLAGLGRSLRMLWGRAKPELFDRIAALMVPAGSDNSRFLGDLVLEGKADAWRGRTLYAVLAALVEHGLGRSHVLALALRRGANEQVRLIAIDCLQRDPELVQEASRFRVGNLLESSAIRGRLSQLRKPPGAGGEKGGKP